MDSSSRLMCTLAKEWLNPDQSIAKKAKWKTVTLSLVRNEFRELFLHIDGIAANNKLPLKGINVHKKFMAEGKASLNFPERRMTIMISNAPPAQLVTFLKTLYVKMSSAKSSPKPGLREQLLSNKPQAIEEISPVNDKDVKRVEKEVSTKLNTKLALNKKRRLSQENKNEVLKKHCIASLTNGTFGLTDEQRNIIEKVQRGRNIFFTGSAGTGKSYLLRCILQALPPQFTVATASTGAAACLIGGTTLHSFAGVGSGEGSIQRSIELASRPQILQSWKKCRHLIVDEISMVDGKYFELVERVAQAVRGNTQVFGGIQLILCGDFLQLPPVNNSASKRFCFQTEAWNNCQFDCYQLKKVHRQNDNSFINLLNSIRVGKVTAEMTELLMSTSKRTLEEAGISATRLCCYTQEARDINSSKLQSLPGEMKTFAASDSDNFASKMLDDLTPVEKNLSLKIGAQVMLVKNININKGLVNGARGRVVSFNKDGIPVVQFRSKLEYPMQAEKWVVKTGTGSVYTRKQIPLRLAWAFSIHKSQGLTLDCVEMSLGNVFEAGQAYVALSRAKSLDSLKVTDFNPRSVWANPDVLKFYARMERNSTVYIPLGEKHSNQLRR